MNTVLQRALDRKIRIKDEDRRTPIRESYCCRNVQQSITFS
ncbi:MAG: hypothetical protein PVG76_05160 [Chromatiales bacterium]